MNKDVGDGITSPHKYPKKTWRIQQPPGVIEELTEPATRTTGCIKGSVLGPELSEKIIQGTLRRVREESLEILEPSERKLTPGNVLWKITDLELRARAALAPDPEKAGQLMAAMKKHFGFLPPPVKDTREESLENGFPEEIMAMGEKERLEFLTGLITKRVETAKEAREMAEEKIRSGEDITEVRNNLFGSGSDGLDPKDREELLEFYTSAREKVMAGEKAIKPFPQLSPIEAEGVSLIRPLDKTIIKNVLERTGDEIEALGTFMCIELRARAMSAETYEESTQWGDVINLFFGYFPRPLSSYDPKTLTPGRIKNFTAFRQLAEADIQGGKDLDEIRKSLQVPRDRGSKDPDSRTKVVAIDDLKRRGIFDVYRTAREMVFPEG